MTAVEFLLTIVGIVTACVLFAWVKDRVFPIPETRRRERRGEVADQFARREKAKLQGAIALFAGIFLFATLQSLSCFGFDGFDRLGMSASQGILLCVSVSSLVMIVMKAMSR